jgi:hypothetical protein
MSNSPILTVLMVLDLHFKLFHSDSQKADLCVFRMYHFIIGIVYLRMLINFYSIFIICNELYYSQK